MAGLRAVPIQPGRVAPALACGLGFLFASSPAVGDVSVRCIYEVITSAYHNMDLCGEALDHDSERTFSDLRSSLKKFINKNAQREADKIGPDFDQMKRDSLRRMSKAYLCEGEDYALVKEILRHMFKPDQIASIKNRLQTPEDPFEGDCL
jgi:hypothetical protein